MYEKLLLSATIMAVGFTSGCGGGSGSSDPESGQNEGVVTSGGPVEWAKIERTWIAYEGENTLSVGERRELRAVSAYSLQSSTPDVDITSEVQWEIEGPGCYGKIERDHARDAVFVRGLLEGSVDVIAYRPGWELLDNGSRFVGRQVFNVSPVPVTGLSEFEESLQGRWTGECRKWGDPFVGVVIGTPYKRVVRFDGKNVYNTTIFYEGDSCSVAAGTHEDDWVAAWEVGDQYMTESGLASFEIDLQYYGKPPEYYSMNECDKDYNIIRVHDGVLYWGGETGQSRLERPEDLDFNNVYIREG